MFNNVMLINVSKYCRNLRELHLNKKFYCSVISEEINWEKELKILGKEKKTLLEQIKNLQPHDFAPYFHPAFNFAAYVNKSENVKQLLELGVNLHSIEKRKGLGKFLIQLNFENEIKNHLLFLNDLGVKMNVIGDFITKNPLIFKEHIEDLQTRVNYLESKKYEPQQIIRIIEKNPFWLMFNTKRIDRRLGFFQKYFQLSGNEVRLLSTKQPKLITYQLKHIRENTFSIKEEMGFTKEETKLLLLNKPKLWMMNINNLLDRFDYLHGTMELKHKQIIQFPEVLTSREFRLKQRHTFLKHLGKAQYDNTKDLYISPKLLVEGDDKNFVFNVAKSSMNLYDNHLRTL